MEDVDFKTTNDSMLFTEDGWKTCSTGIKQNDNKSCYIGNLNDLVTNNDTYIDQFNYYKKHPIEWTEMVLGVKLKWYQKAILKLTYKNKI